MPAVSTIAALQNAVLTYLSSDADIAAYMVGIYEHVPAYPSRPYLHMEINQVNAIHAQNFEAYELIFDLKIESGSRTESGLLTIMECMKSLLHHNTSLVLVQGELSLLEFQNMELSRDDLKDHNIIGNVQFKAIIE